MFRAEAFVHDTYGVRKDVRVPDASLLLDVLPRDEHVHEGDPGLDRGRSDISTETGQDRVPDLAISPLGEERSDEGREGVEILKSEFKMERQNVNKLYNGFLIAKGVLQDISEEGHFGCKICYPAYYTLKRDFQDAIDKMEDAFISYEESKNVDLTE